MSDAFRQGFLYALADRGLTPEEFGQALLEKRATFGSTLGFSGGLGDVLTAGLVGAPIALGGLGGYMAAEATRPQYDVSVQALKNKELVDKLRLATRQLNLHAPPSGAVTSARSQRQRPAAPVVPV